MLALKKAASAAATVPTLEELSPEHVRLTRRDRDLRMRLGELAVEIEELSRRRNLTTSSTRVADLVSGETPTAAADSLPDRSGVLRQEKSDILVALESIRIRLADERRKASETAWVELAPVHREKVKAVVISLAVALAAHKELERFRGEINSAGLSWLSVPRFVATAVLGDVHDDQAEVRRLLEQAARDDFVTDGELAVVLH